MQTDTSPTTKPMPIEERVLLYKPEDFARSLPWREKRFLELAQDFNANTDELKNLAHDILVIWQRMEKLGITLPYLSNPPLSLLTNIALVLPFSKSAQLPPRSNTAAAPFPVPSPQDSKAHITEKAVVRLPVPPPLSFPLDGIVLGVDTITNELLHLGDLDLTSHLDIIGKIGSGKTTLEQFIALQFIARGIGVCYVDPHGDAIEYLISHMPASRLRDVILIAPGNEKLPTAVGMPLVHRSSRSIDKDINRLLNIFKQIWGPGSTMPFYGPRLELILTMCIKTLLLTGYTFSEFPLLLRVPEFRKKVLKELQEQHGSEQVLSFMWEFDFNKLSTYLQHEKSESTLYKIYRLLDTEAVPLVASQPQETVNWRSCIDAGKIVLLDVSNLDEETQKFLTTIFLSTFFEAAFSRQDMPIANRTPYSLIIDEFNRFALPQMTEVFRELRKFGVSVTVGYQVRSKMTDELQGALQNLANHVAFTIGKDDAIELASTFARSPQSEYQDREKKLPAKRPIDYLVLAGRPHNDEVVSDFAYFFEQDVRLDSRTTKTVSTDLNLTIPGAALPLKDIPFSPSLSAKQYMKPPQRRSSEYATKFSALRELRWQQNYIKPELLPASHHREGKPRMPLTSQVYNPRSLETLNEFLYKVMMVPKNAPRVVFPSSELEKALQFVHGSTESLYVLTGPIENYWKTWGELTKEEKAQTHIHPFRSYPVAILTAETYERLWTCEDAALPAGLQVCRANLAKAIRENLDERVTPKRVQEVVQVASVEAYITELTDKLMVPFEAAIETIRHITTALAADPILLGTGEVELVEVRRRPVADMIKEMELYLQRLPKYTAMVHRRGYDTEGVEMAMVSPAMIDAVFPACKPEAYETRMNLIISQTNMVGTDKEQVKAWLQGRHTSFLTGRGVAVTEVKPTESEQKALPEAALAEPEKTQHPIVFTGVTTTPETYLTLLYYFSNLTAKQAIYLAYCDTSNKVRNNKEQAKLKTLVDTGLVEVKTYPFIRGSGRSPGIYSLTKQGYIKLELEKGLRPIHHGDFDEHAHIVCEVLTSLVVGSKNAPLLSLLTFTSEKMFRQQNIPLTNKRGLEPDGLLTFTYKGEKVTVLVEVDLSTEGITYLRDEKLQKYLEALDTKPHPGFTADTIAVVFLVPDTAKVERIVRIIQAALAGRERDAKHFFVGTFAPDSTEGKDYYFSPIYKHPFETNTVALLE